MWILYGGSHPDHLPLLAEQQQLEQALEIRARELGASIRRDSTLTDFSQDADGVTVTLGDGSTLRAGWLVGNDGGRSTVRKRAGIAFPGTDGIITGYQAATEYDDPDFIEYGWHRLPGGLLLRRSEPSSVLTVEFDRPPAEAPVTQEEVQAAVRRISGTQVTLTGCTSVTRFTDNARQAETYRSGRAQAACSARARTSTLSANSSPTSRRSRTRTPCSPTS